MTPESRLRLDTLRRLRVVRRLSEDEKRELGELARQLVLESGVRAGLERGAREVLGCAPGRGGPR